MQVAQKNAQVEWVNILSKGIITIPKKMRELVGIKEGDIAKIKVEGNTIIIEPREQISLDQVRTFSNEQIEQWIKDDELPSDLAKDTADYWNNLP